MAKKPEEGEETRLEALKLASARHRNVDDALAEAARFEQFLKHGAEAPPDGDNPFD